jgi:hypothetical protein
VVAERLRQLAEDPAPLLVRHRDRAAAGRDLVEDFPEATGSQLSQAAEAPKFAADLKACGVSF